MTYISCKEFGQALGVTRQAVHQMITSGRVKADRVGNVFVIQKSQLERFKKRDDWAKNNYKIQEVI
jgi:excisionase family DNA binding protein